ncbi:FAD-binding protein [Streptomyces ipomoeae]|uniref:FAD-binding protein n=1 Tax=Streptomyces ipomoeae TaxID=103232 RepID=A0A540P9Y4_9ACTN|nr:FAD-binding protein [Streptomyces ipomoeae]TQE20717.1 FAD-binding protein [Streptomyces ipomoeae]TQE28428.1 FAD-binding protein [Streptomyces ipomoeae]
MSCKEQHGPVSRRRFLARFGAGTVALVAGFDLVARQWVTEAVAADTADSTSFAAAPSLDGTLTFDPEAIAANSHDQGNIVFRTPCAVLRPGSVQDIRKMVAFCASHNIKVAPVGAHHAMFGQPLVSGGLIIEMQSLNTIHSIGTDGADVDTGVLWQDVIEAAYAQGLTPASITSYIRTTVGGTLSMGGIGMMSAYRVGAQVDHARLLQVVTGTGQLKWCSATQNSELFEATLAGLGQCGVITRATIDLVPAKQRARTYRIGYADIPTFFQDIRILANRGEFDSLGSIPQPGTAQPLVLWATVFYDPGDVPDGSHLLRGLSPAAGAAPFEDYGYLDYISLVTNLYDSFAANLDWDAKVKPWSDLFLPDGAVEDFVESVFPSLTPEDLGPTGFGLIFPMLRSSYGRPLLRLPSGASGPWVWLVSVLTDSVESGPDPDFASRMMDRNYSLYQQAAAVGGVRYPHGATPFTQADWQAHYGSLWTQFVTWKNRYDPNGILTPGPGIF